MSFGFDDSGTGSGDPNDPWGGDNFDSGRPMSQGWVRGVGVVAIAVVVGVLLVPSATRAPLAVTTISQTSATSSTTTAGQGATTSSSVPPRTTSTTTPAVISGAAAIRVLVANATSISHLAGGTAAYLHSRGFDTLPAANATMQVTATQVYAASGSQAAARSVVNALGLPTGAVQPSSAVAPVASTSGATVVVIVGPDLSRYASTTSTG